MPIHVLLVEDHALVRAGIRALLQHLSDVVVVGEASTGREALALVGTVHPDIVLMDISMPDLDGLEAAARLARDEPHTRIIILSMHAAEEYVRQAFKVGAAGYVLKDAVPAELELAIRAVARGETFLSPGVSRPVTERYVSGRGAESSHPLDRVTPRQREVLRLVAQGKSTKDIAFDLGLSVKTVETHRAQLMKRLDIHDVAGLVRLAVRTGLVE